MVVGGCSTTHNLSCDGSPEEVPYHDLWIGALALQHNVEVVSRDAHFDLMPDVRRIGW